MTTIQDATITHSTVEVLPGGDFAPYAKITHCSAWGCVTYVPRLLGSVDFEQLQAAGFDIIDPHHYVTCACGAYIGVWEIQCLDCAATERDYYAEQVMYHELRYGM